MARSHVVLMLATLLAAALPGGARAQPLPQSGAAVPPADGRTLILPSDDRHTLFIPDDYEHRGEAVDLLFDFHGFPAWVHANAQHAGLNAVVISVKYRGLSSVYRVPFSEDRELFGRILDEALTALRGLEDFSDEAQWGKIGVSSFSAGFGAVREVLKTQAYFDRIDAILMVDSLYCGYVEGDEQRVDPELMKDFLRYARAAAAGEKVMIITHTQEPTPGYASTTEVADWLIGKIRDLEVRRIDERGLGTLRFHRLARRGDLAIWGTLGRTAADHLHHLKYMGQWLGDLPLSRIDGAGEIRESP